MLYYSSFLILLPIFYGQGTLLGALYTLLLGVSVLNHAKKHETYPGKRWVEVTDKVIVYAIASTQIFYAIMLINNPNCLFPLALFWSCFIYVVYNYHFKRRAILKQQEKDKEKKLIINHILFHIACITGGFSIMYCIRCYSNNADNPR